MPYEDWLNEGVIRPHDLNLRQVRKRTAEMLDLAEEHLGHAHASGLSLDAHHNFAYASARVAAEVIMLVKGYRPGHHGSNHVSVLRFLGRAERGRWRKLSRRFDLARRHRNVAEYERVGTITHTEFDEMLELTRNFVDEVRDWLRVRHPELLPPRPTTEPS